jgi:alpha-galactosidase
MNLKTAIFCLFSICFLQANAQTGANISIETKNVSLLFTVKSNQRLYQNYLGEKLRNTSENALFPAGRSEAYVGAGMDDFFEPAVAVVHSDGNPSLLLNYVSHHTEKEAQNVTHTSIKLKDPQYPVEVILHFVAYFNEDIIKEWTEIKNQEKKPITLTKFASSMLHLEATKYWLTQFDSDYYAEMRLKESQLTNGIKTIDSKLGTRTHFYQAPTFFLALNKPATENSGEVLAGALSWTGNFQCNFEVDPQNFLRLTTGMNPYASAYRLESGKTFTTPEFVFTHTMLGKGEATRNLHRWARNYAVLDGNKPRLTLLNNWEATHMGFNEKMLVDLFDGAKKLGVDLFLLDDGWFGNKYPRNNDKAGLGDWQVDKKKLPNGIGYLVKEAKDKDLKFGIWIEPEMVNPKSELYEKHPEWVLKLPNREESYFRNQLILDLVNPKVQDFVYNMVNDLLTENPGISYIKWDCNRMMTNEYSPFLKENQGNLSVDYTKSFYEVLKRIRAKHPHIPIMLCSGGGGRTDYGAMKYFTEFWPSDNTDGLERIWIQWGYLHFFPSLTVANHITSMGKQSIKFRTDVAMMGKVGYDIKVNEMPEQDLLFSTQAIKNYNRLSDVIWFGNLYRIVSPYEENRAVLMYVSEDKNKAVLFNYILNYKRKDLIGKMLLDGLDANKMYKIEEINLMPGTKSTHPDNGKIYSGDYLKKVGLKPGRLAVLTSAVFEITAQ